MSNVIQKLDEYIPTTSVFQATIPKPLGKRIYLALKYLEEKGSVPKGTADEVFFGNSGERANFVRWVLRSFVETVERLMLMEESEVADSTGMGNEPDNGAQISPVGEGAVGGEQGGTAETGSEPVEEASEEEGDGGESEQEDNGGANVDLEGFIEI